MSEAVFRVKICADTAIKRQRCIQKIIENRSYERPYVAHVKHRFLLKPFF